MSNDVLDDPSGLLDRIPELEGLARHSTALRRSIQRGNPHTVYRTLWWLRVFGKLRDQRTVLDALLGQRRLFLKPIRSAPVLFTVNGCGATVYGSTDTDAND